MDELLLKNLAPHGFQGMGYIEVISLIMVPTHWVCARVVGSLLVTPVLMSLHLDLELKYN